MGAIAARSGELTVPTTLSAPSSSWTCATRIAILRLEPDFGAHADGLGGGEAEVVDGVGGVVGDGEESTATVTR